MIDIDDRRVPKNLNEMVLADMRRAMRLKRTVEDEIDPQFRIASPEGDWWIGITLTNDAEERWRRLQLLSDFMAWKLSLGFVMGMRTRRARRNFWLRSHGR